MKNPTPKRKLNDVTFTLGDKPTKQQRKLLWCEGKHLRQAQAGDAMFGRVQG